MDDELCICCGRSGLGCHRSAAFAPGPSILLFLSFQVASACCEDNPDALTHHELLLPGHLLLKFLREKLQDGLGTLKEVLRREMDRNPEAVNLEVRAGGHGPELWSLRCLPAAYRNMLPTLMKC
jgi:hypothetical protein